jgi:hypothetical protein
MGFIPLRVAKGQILSLEVREYEMRNIQNAQSEERRSEVCGMRNA